MKKKTSFVLILLLIFSFAYSIHAAELEEYEKIIDKTAECILKTVTKPQIGSVGGEWTILGLRQSGYAVDDEYYSNYYTSLEEYIKSVDGVLHKRKYTEYSRVILALDAIGKNPSDVGGYNLLMPLGDYENTVMQGINGAIWALIALDSGDYEIPINNMAKTQATRDMYLDKILDSQLADGGWSMGKEESDIDVTAMALCALSEYTYRDDVNKASERAIIMLSERQNENGGFLCMGEENSESTAQVITALCKLGISLDDTRFVKKGNSLFDNLMSYVLYDGGFSHTKGGGFNLMATEQALGALNAVKDMVKPESFESITVEFCKQNNLFDGCFFWINSDKYVLRKNFAEAVYNVMRKAKR